MSPSRRSAVVLCWCRRSAVVRPPSRSFRRSRSCRLSGRAAWWFRCKVWAFPSPGAAEIVWRPRPHSDPSRKRRANPLHVRGVSRPAPRYGRTTKTGMVPAGTGMFPLARGVPLLERGVPAGRGCPWNGDVPAGTEECAFPFSHTIGTLPGCGGHSRQRQRRPHAADALILLFGAPITSVAKPAQAPHLLRSAQEIASDEPEGAAVLNGVGGSRNGTMVFPCLGTTAGEARPPRGPI